MLLIVGILDAGPDRSNSRKGSQSAPSTRSADPWDSSPTRANHKPTQKLPFAAFSTYEKDRSALANTLIKVYGNDNVAGTTRHFSPAGDGNDVSSYSSYIIESGDIPSDANFDSLTATQIQSAMDAIEHFEGLNRCGNMEKYSYPGPF